ncbi:Cytosine deaminase [Candidatus Arthromitus sp. SFB-4]|nr:Cytosine deaminase [Candidatus Arthromitus sp. SFB-4]
MNIQDSYGIKEGNPGNLIILNGNNDYDIIQKRSSVLYSIRNGKIISNTIPSKTFINIDNKSEEINFKK